MESACHATSKLCFIFCNCCFIKYLSLHDALSPISQGCKARLLSVVIDSDKAPWDDTNNNTSAYSVAGDSVNGK